MAARDGLIEIVTILLARGANPNLQNRVGKRSHIFVHKMYETIFGQSENENFTYFHINTEFQCPHLFPFLIQHAYKARHKDLTPTQAHVLNTKTRYKRNFPRENMAQLSINL